MKKLFSVTAITGILVLLSTSMVFSQIPQSTHYKIQDYGFGSGGVATSSSTHYTMNGIAGETAVGSASSTTYVANSGLSYIQNAYVPPAPTFTNPATNYDRLLLKIATGGNPTDATYAVEISTDNFVSDKRYIQSDFTVGSILNSGNFMSYSTWGGSSGQYITGLQANTTYYVRVAAMQGSFTQTQWGPIASATTSNPSLSFSVDSYSLNFNPLSASNSYTDSSHSNVLTTSTNAYGGYIIYGKLTQALTSNDGNTIANYGSPNSAPTTWSGTGFGYTTSDTNLLAGSGGANRFASGTKYAGFQTSGNGDPVANHPTNIVNPAVSNEQFTISYYLAGNSTTPAGTYKTTIEYTIVPSY